MNRGTFTFITAIQDETHRFANAYRKQQMRQTWQHILDALCNVLRHDTKIRPDAFTEQFTPEQFAGILFSLMLSAVVQQDFDPTAVLEIIRRTIYEV